MTLYQTEYRSKVRKEKSKEAIALAMERHWEDAVYINRSIIQIFPDDIEAHNRLGKAYVELGEYNEARAAFAKALQLSPSNNIARKNLDRLAHLRRDEQLPKKGHKLSPQHFLEESGKSGTAILEQPTNREALARIAAGDAVILGIDDRSLLVESGDGTYLGLVPPRMALRLVRLMQGGNGYEAAVARLNGDEVTIIIREVYQHSNQRGITSFPSRGEPQYVYPRAALLDVDLQEEEDEEMEAAFNAEWEDNGEVTDTYSRSVLVPKSLDSGEEEEA